jgi:hypothetical protein
LAITICSSQQFTDSGGGCNARIDASLQRRKVSHSAAARAFSQSPNYRYGLIGVTLMVPLH